MLTLKSFSILRILFMIPVYSVVSFLGYYFYHHFVYYQVIRDCYDAFAIASFFSLLCHYTAPDLHGQKDYFRMLTPKNWLLPVTWFQKCCGSQRQGPWRIPRSGLTWFNVCLSVDLWLFSLIGSGCLGVYIPILPFETDSHHSRCYHPVLW